MRISKHSTISFRDYCYGAFKKDIYSNILTDYGNTCPLKSFLGDLTQFGQDKYIIQKLINCVSTGLEIPHNEQ